MNGNEDYKRAKQRVAEIRGFYQHLFIYIIVNIGIFIINIITDSHHHCHPQLDWGYGFIGPF